MARDEEPKITRIERGSSRVNRLIAHHMMGEITPDDYPNKSKVPYPYDGWDMRDCVNFMSKRPEWRARIGEMAQYSVRWKAIAENWALLEEKVAAGEAEDTQQTLNDVTNTLIDQRHALMRNPTLEKNAELLIDADEGNHNIKFSSATQAVLFANHVAQKLYDGGYKAYWVSIGSKQCPGGHVANASFRKAAHLSKYPLEDGAANAMLPATVIVRFSRDNPELPELEKDIGKQ